VNESCWRATCLNDRELHDAGMVYHLHDEDPVPEEWRDGNQGVIMSVVETKDIPPSGKPGPKPKRASFQAGVK
jgi:hypothetical protein